MVRQSSFLHPVQQRVVALSTFRVCGIGISSWLLFLLLFGLPLAVVTTLAARLQTAPIPSGIDRDQRDRGGKEPSTECVEFDRPLPTSGYDVLAFYAWKGGKVMLFVQPTRDMPVPKYRALCGADAPGEFFTVTE